MPGRFAPPLPPDWTPLRGRWAHAHRPAALASFRTVAQGLTHAAAPRDGTGRRDVRAALGRSCAHSGLSFSDLSGLRASRPAIESFAAARTYGTGHPVEFDSPPE